VLNFTAPSHVLDTIDESYKDTIDESYGGGSDEEDY